MHLPGTNPLLSFRSKSGEDELGSPTEDGAPPIPAHGRTDGNGNPEDDDLLQVGLSFRAGLRTEYLGYLGYHGYLGLHLDPVKVQVASDIIWQQILKDEVYL